MRRRLKRAGERTTQVRFEYPVKTKDGGGGFTIVWTTRCTEWCALERMQSLRIASEQLIAGGLRPSSVVRLHVVSHSVSELINIADRGVNVATGKIYNIRDVQDLEGRGRELAITASEDVPA